MRNVAGIKLGMVVLCGAWLIGLVGCGERAGRVPGASSQTTGNGAASSASQGSTSQSSETQPSTSTQSSSTQSASSSEGQSVKQQSSNESPASAKIETAMFGGGCFWGVEHIFQKEVPGVIEAVSGYSGGHVKNPTYKQVCYEDTGHVEVVQVKFDPAKVSYEQLVNFFYRMIDPTQVNGQGPDLGDQYRSVVFYYSEDQKKIAEKVKAERASKYKKPIAVVNEPAPEFYKAEDYHQDYYVVNKKTPYCHFLRPE